MAFMDRNGTQIYYEVHGSGPVILLSHGYGATASMWAGQHQAFDGYQLITWDMRGHGQSDSPDGADLYSVEHTLHDMLAILEKCNATSAIIGGLSLGGYMSLAFNLEYASRVAALLLFDTGPGFRNDEARQGWNRFAEKRAAKFEKDGLASLGSGEEVRISQHQSAQGLAHAARGMLAQTDGRVIESLAQIEKPTLLLVGEQDEAFLGATDYMERKIPGAQKVIIENAGHAANIDQPEIFNREVNRFLAGL
jgi:pimeloyl-ACP methyl ester carboxylesterase